MKNNQKNENSKPGFYKSEKKIKFEAKQKPEKKIITGNSSYNNHTNELDPHLDFPTKDEETIYNILDWEYRDIFRNSKISKEKKDLKVLKKVFYLA